MPNFIVNLRKRDLGDSFEMVIDPFMFNMDMTALADVANALVDTGKHPCLCCFCLLT